MGWLEASRVNLLPLSREKINFRAALTEWLYTGNYNDLEFERTHCELCEHPEIRFQFEIRNQYTGNRLLVGSECIRKFSISALDDDGTILEAEAAGRKVGRDRQTLINEAEARQIVRTLVELASIDDEFEIDSFVEYFQDRGAFTPNQLALLLWRLTKCGISYSKCRFKIVIRRKREKAQLREMPDWKLQKIAPYLSAVQNEVCSRLRSQVVLD